MPRRRANNNNRRGGRRRPVASSGNEVAPVAQIPRTMLNPNSISYTGPLNIPGASEQSHVTIQRLSGYAAVTTNGGTGVVSGSYALRNPSTSMGWTGFAAAFDEFRVLAAELIFMPVDRYSAPLAVTTAITEPTCLIGIDRDSNGPGTTVNSALEYESVRHVTLTDPWKLVYRMSGMQDCIWVTTATPANAKAGGFWFLGTQASGTLSLPMGVVTYHYLVQFRGAN